MSGPQPGCSLDPPQAYVPRSVDPGFVLVSIHTENHGPSEWGMDGSDLEYESILDAVL